MSPQAQLVKMLILDGVFIAVGTAIWLAPERLFRSLGPARYDRNPPLPRSIQIIRYVAAFGVISAIADIVLRLLGVWR